MNYRLHTKINGIPVVYGLPLTVALVVMVFFVIGVLSCIISFFIGAAILSVDLLIYTVGSIYVKKYGNYFLNKFIHSISSEWEARRKRVKLMEP